jgi:hypothetical protein
MLLVRLGLVTLGALLVAQALWRYGRGDARRLREGVLHAGLILSPIGMVAERLERKARWFVRTWVVWGVVVGAFFVCLLAGGPERLLLVLLVLVGVIAAIGMYLGIETHRLEASLRRDLPWLK